MLARFESVASASLVGSADNDLDNLFDALQAIEEDQSDVLRIALFSLATCDASSTEFRFQLSRVKRALAQDSLLFPPLPFTPSRPIEHGRISVNGTRAAATRLNAP